MAENNTDSERIIPNLFKIDHEYVFKVIGRKGRYSLEVKCLFLVLVLFIPGLIANFFAGMVSGVRPNFLGTLPSYIMRGGGHLFATIFIGIFLWSLLRYFRLIDEKIRHINDIICPPTLSKDKKPHQEGKNDPNNKEWEKWRNKRDKFKKWCRDKAIAVSWYYFCAIGGAIVGLILSIRLIGPEHGWTQGFILPELYLRTWYVFLGFIAGASFQFISVGFWVIRKYCKDVVSQDVIRPLDPDSTGGLRELGRLSLDLDLIVATPSIALPIVFILLKRREFLGYEIENIEVTIVLAALYALLLVVIFFISISPAHDNMVKAKTDYLMKIHDEYKDMHKALVRKLKPGELIAPEEYERLLNLYKLHDRVEHMAVWPLDFRTVGRFVITSILPLISVGITYSLTP